MSARDTEKSSVVFSDLFVMLLVSRRSGEIFTMPDKTAEELHKKTFFGTKHYCGKHIRKIQELEKAVVFVSVEDFNKVALPDCGNKEAVRKSRLKNVDLVECAIIAKK
jgi:hypothetical protein